MMANKRVHLTAIPLRPRRAWPCSIAASDPRRSARNTNHALHYIVTLRIHFCATSFGR